MKLAPTFLKEVFSHYKRRLIEFISTSKEFIRLLGPFLLTVNFILLLEASFLIIFEKVDKDITDKDNDLIKQIAYSATFGFFVIVGMIYSVSIFGSTLANDRKNDLRYLLNLNGTSSFAYFLGLSLADSLLHLVPSVMIFILAAIIKIDYIVNNFGFFFLQCLCVCWP